MSPRVLERAGAGVRVGHWTDPRGRTGCTVVLLPEGTVAGVEVRGGAPATRELDLLDPQRTVQRADAILLAGGSAFGLAAADGVMRYCEERGMGFPTAAGPVPIVPALAVFDLLEGEPVRPGAAEGYAACEAAVEAGIELGRVGAGTGATIAKWRGREHARPGGVGGAVLEHNGLSVAAVIVVNAFGDLRDPDAPPRIPPEALAPTAAAFGNTTVGAVVTNATLSKSECQRAAVSGHVGMARALDPVHTSADGDALVVAATGLVEARLEVVSALAAVVVEQAIRTGVGG